MRRFPAGRVKNNFGAAGLKASAALLYAKDMLGSACRMQPGLRTKTTILSCMKKATVVNRLFLRLDAGRGKGVIF